MLEIFFPKLIVDKVQDVDFDMLIKNNIKGLILDIDNTLVPNHVEEADDNAVKWLEKVQTAGLKACLVSNNTEDRVVKFNKKLKLYAVHKALKPGKKGLMKAAGIMGIKPDEIAVIGDQIFTDVYGGNKLGMFTVLVTPLDKNEFVLIKLKRLVEKIVMARYRKKIMNLK